MSYSNTSQRLLLTALFAIPMMLSAACGKCTSSCDSCTTSSTSKCGDRPTCKDGDDIYEAVVEVKVGGEEKEYRRRYDPKRTLDYVTRVHAAKMKKRHRLRWIASRGLHKDQTDKIHLVYESIHARSEKEVRTMLVDLVRTYVDLINSFDPPLPQIGHLPWRIEDLKVEIRFDSFFAEYVDRSYVEFATLEDGIVTYQAYNCCRRDACFTRREQWIQAKHQVEINKEWDTAQVPDAELERFLQEAFEDTPATPPPSREQQQQQQRQQYRR